MKVVSKEEQQAIEEFKRETEGSNIIDFPLKYYTYNAQNQLKFNCHMVKDEILADKPIYRSDIGTLRYENGVYKRSSNGDILHIIQKKIGEEATDSRKKEILSLMLHENEAIPLSTFNKGIPYLNLKNGFYNIKHKLFMDHSENGKYILSTIQQPIKYDTEAKCPAILEFLHDILDEDGVQFVIEWLAYCCLPYTDPDKILFLYGKGGNGKSALLNLFKQFLGLENTTAMSLHDIEKREFSRAHLYGKLANICGDIDNRVIANTGIIKSLTGGEEIYAEFKGVDGFNFRSFAKLMFSANELPMSMDKTEGYFRRIFILPFEKTLVEEKKVSRTELDKRLTDSKELSGLLNLVIKAIHKLEKNGYRFTIPESAKRALEQYKHVHDKVGQFIDEQCIIDKEDDSKRIPLKHFYHALVDWVEENGMKYTEQLRKVGEQLRDKGFKVQKSTGNKTFIYGLTFSPDSDYLKYNGK